MNQIDELITLAQKLDAVMDDSESVISVSISSNSVVFLTDTEYLLRNFDNVDVIRKKDRDYPFLLETYTDGVAFRTHVRLDEVELLRGSIPDEWIDEVTGPKKEVHKIRSLRQTDISETKKAD